MTTLLPSGNLTMTSGRKFLPSSSLVFSWIKNSSSFRNPLFSRMVSSTISPQSPCILLSPFRARVRLAASEPIFEVCSFNKETACCCSCWKSFIVASKVFCSSFLFTSFWVLLSSTDFLKSANCSLIGFNSSSICRRLFSCKADCLAASCSAATFWCSAFMRCMSCFSVSIFCAHCWSLSARSLVAYWRSLSICPFSDCISEACASLNACISSAWWALSFFRITS